MSSVALPPPGSGQTDHFGAALVFSVLLHVALIFGIAFHFAKPAPRVPTLEVTLLNTANGKTPTRADFLAQANNAGGGNSEQAHRPGAPVSGPLPVMLAGVAPVPVLPAAPKQRTASGPHILSTSGHAKRTVAQQRDTRAEPASSRRVARIPIAQRLEMARLTQEVRDEQEAYARRPRRKYVSANTRSVADAAYQVAWVHRIERVGNLNYPSAARRRHLHGDLVLSVVLGRNGDVLGVTVNKSSGYRILDDAAIRIVHLAAPFPPIPHDRGPDGHPITELVITRTWQFLPGGRLKTGQTGAR